MFGKLQYTIPERVSSYNVLSNRGFSWLTFDAFA